jgi:hypothetical protein
MDWTAIATFVLASIATAAIVVTLIIRAKDIAENRRIREEERELNFKSRLLDEVRDWAREAVMLGFLYNRAKSESEILQVVTRMEEIAKTTDAANISAEVFGDELTGPVNRAISALAKCGKGKLDNKEYFDSFYAVLKVIISLKKKIILQG